MAAQDWKQEMLWLTILYRVLECKDAISIDTDGTKFSFIEKDLRAMHSEGLLEIAADNSRWTVTSKGKGVRDKMVAIFDNCLKFEIFGDVSLARELTEDESEDGTHVFDHYYDSRFEPPNSDAKREEWGTEDMRIAMMTYLAETMKETDEGESYKGSLDLDPHRIVFMQRITEGVFKDENIWFDLALGKPFEDIEEVVTTAYKYTDVSEDPGEIDAVMQTIYTAGMLEQRKRDGLECAKCRIPIAVFEMNAKEDGQTLDACPNPDCGHDFGDAPPPAMARGEGGSGGAQSEYACPSCDSAIYAGQNSCNGCGARIDFSLPAGTVSEETVVETTYVEDYGYSWGWGGYDAYYGYGYGYDAWGGYYGYSPYGYYDPWDPVVDMVAFGCVCAVLW